MVSEAFCLAIPHVSTKPLLLQPNLPPTPLSFSPLPVFLSLHRIRIIEAVEPQLQVEGFATYTDVQAADLVPWTPLKAGYSHMDAESALFILQRVAQQFLGVVAAEAATLPDGEGQ